MQNSKDNFLNFIQFYNESILLQLSLVDRLICTESYLDYQISSVEKIMSRITVSSRKRNSQEAFLKTATLKGALLPAMRNYSCYTLSVLVSYVPHRIALHRSLSCRSQ